MSNRSAGLGFENRFCETLSENGFWVLHIPQVAAGQPADVLAVKNNHAYLIDCKHCSKSTFQLSRVEPNQVTAMTLFRSCHNTDAWFALHINLQVYMVSFSTVMKYRYAKSAMTLSDIKADGLPLERWLEKCL